MRQGQGVCGGLTIVATDVSVSIGIAMQGQGVCGGLTIVATDVSVSMDSEARTGCVWWTYHSCH